MHDRMLLFDLFGRRHNIQTYARIKLAKTGEYERSEAELCPRENKNVKENRHILHHILSFSCKTRSNLHHTVRKLQYKANSLIFESYLCLYNH